MNFAGEYDVYTRPREYDAYMRPVVNLGHCHFKGGGSHTTTVQERTIPTQTGREAALEGDLYKYGTAGLGQANYYRNLGSQAAENLPRYDWSSLQRQYDQNAKRALADFNLESDYAKNRYESKLYGATNDYQRLLDQLSDASDSNARQYSKWQLSDARRYANQMDLASKNAWNAQNVYQTNQRAALGEYQNALNSLRDQYNEKTFGVNQGYADLINGKLPSTYAAARQAALKDDLEKSLGNTISNMASRGIMNSSVTSRAMNDISQNASDTLAKQYTNDLQTAAGLLAQGNGQYENWYKNNAEMAGNAYNAASSSNQGILSAMQTALASQTTNAGNAYNAATGTNKSVLDAMQQSVANQTANAGSAFNAQSATAKNVFDSAYQTEKEKYDAAMQNYQSALNMAAVTQNAGLALPSALYGYADQLAAPAQNMYNQMYSGRMGTGTTTSSTSQSGSSSANMWGLAGSLGSAMLIACFTGDTLITTPDGYKPIKDIQVGDEVYSVSGGHRAVKKVKAVSDPHDVEIIDVTFKNGAVWHTTATQRYFDGLHFHNICSQGEGFDMDGLRWDVVRVFRTGKTDRVYDFTLEGPRGDNVFFAEDMAAEGF